MRRLMFFASLDKSAFHVSLVDLVLILPDRISGKYNYFNKLVDWDYLTSRVQLGIT